MADRIHHDELISELLARKPHLRWVFDRYGLRGCGGVSGPPESIRFFAQTHGVDENQLLNELAGASNRPARPVAAHRVDSAYRLFFAAGAVTALSAGALLGTWFMFRMGASGSYFEPGIHRLNAHAFAMIYGFVGAFVIGFGYQALPRFKHTVVRDPALVPITFALLVGGVTLRFFGQFFAHDESFTSVVYNPYGAGLAVAGTVLTFGAFLLFGIELLRTYRSSGKKIEEYDRWVFASLFWFVVSLALSGVYYLVLLQARDFSGLVLRVSTLQDALRNVQLFGAVSMVVLGVMQRFLPPVLGFRAPSERLFRRLFWLVNGGLLLMVISFPVSMAIQHGWIEAEAAMPIFRGVYYLGALLLAGGLIGAIASFAPWRRTTTSDRSTKFVRAASFWLLVALVMLLLEPVYIIGVLRTFGHGYHGGMRHALTLGFVVMMIVAVSVKVVPTLNGADPARLGRLVPLFVLLNLAIAGRVACEIAGDFTTDALKFLAPTGAALLVALALWAGHLVKVVVATPDIGTPEPIREAEPDSKVGAIVEQHPATLEVFIRHGFALLSNPVARRTIARKVSLEQVCRMHGKDLGSLIADLNEAIGRGHQKRETT
ncbi:MAG: DUF1858 domain-containing protein [Planctomycetes bacterium]|nr:DUF1858 domain-containing protein [Planctomycetota bacterium]